MYQKTIIVGNLGRDPEMRMTDSGVPYTKFSVAVNRTYTNRNDEKVEETTWFNVTAWRRLAEICDQYLTKGQKVLVDGEIQEPRIWEGDDGEPRTSLDLQANNVQFLNTRAEAEALAETTTGYSGSGSSSSNEDPFA